MPTNQVQTFQNSKADEPNEPENVILRALVGDPSRHKPLVTHPPPSATPTTQESIPAAMYTLETRYRPIPQKVLPQHTEPRVYYLQRENPERTPTPPLPRDEADKIVPVEQENPPVDFLEPKVIPQPILYSIVGAKTLPVVNEQPIVVDDEYTSTPMFHTVVGHPRQVAEKKTSVVTSETIDKSPVLYALVSNPRFHVRIEEPVKQISQSQQSTTIIHTTNSAVQPVPTLYSIVGCPPSVPNITEVPTSAPLAYSENDETIQPVPILYTIVGESQVPNKIPSESRQPLATSKQQNANNSSAMYAVIGDPAKPRSMTLPPNTKQTTVKQEQPTTNQLQPSFYTIVGQHNSFPDEDRLKPMTRRKSPPAPILPTRRVSRSLDRQSAPEPNSEPMDRIPRAKRKVLPKIRDSQNTRNETVFFPVPANERTPRSKHNYNPPWKISPEQQPRKNFQVPRYDPILLPDYVSPYAYHPTKPYREETVHPYSLPIISTGRKSQENDQSPNRKRRYDSRTPHSLERHNQNMRTRARLWDYEYNSQTDIDDEDTNGMTSDASRQRYRRFRPRTPWVPVW